MYFIQVLILFSLQINLISSEDVFINSGIAIECKDFYRFHSEIVEHVVPSRTLCVLKCYKLGKKCPRCEYDESKKLCKLTVLTNSQLSEDESAVRLFTNDFKYKRECWLPIQRRVSGSVSFDRNWDEYETGFGDVKENFWLGLEKMHQWTVTPRPIRFRAWMWNDTEYQFQFQHFQVRNKTTNYTLKLDKFNSSMSSNFPKCKNGLLWNKNMQFTTKDRDNDMLSANNCAKKFGGAGWWYNKCTTVSPNVKYCPSESCDGNVKNIKLGCVAGAAYSMKMFALDVFVDSDDFN